MWKMKFVIIAVVTGDTGTVTTYLKKFGIRTRKTLNTFVTKDSHTCNITNYTESTAV
jgi:hypothetical protein